MVTGDNKITATAIARECYILPADKKEMDATQGPDAILEGPEFYERMGGLICKNAGCGKEPTKCECGEKINEGVKNAAEFKKLHKSLRVLARSRPEDKYLLVTGLKELGDIVAVTGDGTNDAPALKCAHLGVAMQSGTEVSKEAGDMILLDNNFASIIRAIESGRLLSDNLKKVAIYLLPGGR